MATVTGTNGNDRIGVGFTSPGVDPRTGATDGPDSISALDGADGVLGGSGDDTIFGGAGNDGPLSGQAGNDIVNGGSGNDTLNGGFGDDILDGGLDGLVDVLRGGPGADGFFNPVGEDTIVDFNAAEGDFFFV